MVEDGFEKESRERINLRIRRDEAGNPSQEQIDYVMQEVVPLVRSGFIDGIGEPRRVFDDLSKFKLDEQKNGTSLSRPLLCAYTLFLYEVCDKFIGLARRADSENDIEQFRFFFDFGRGSELVLHSIFGAEEGLSDRGEESRLEATSLASKMLDISTGEAAEGYLRMKRDETYSLGLLRQDPSGFLLLDSVVEKVKADSDFHIGLHTKEYVLAGAEVARDLYKKIYEIAAPLYPEK